MMKVMCPRIQMYVVQDERQSTLITFVKTLTCIHDTFVCSLQEHSPTASPLISNHFIYMCLSLSAAVV